MEQLKLSTIKRDGGTQSRLHLDSSVVIEYAEAMLDGDAFPPIIVFYDGESYILADGFHRTAAAAQAGHTHINAEIKQGTQRDAVLYSVGANANHGLRRSHADKRQAVERLLLDDEWRQWSNRELARLANVSHAFVGRIRDELESTGNISSATERKTADGRVMSTDGINGDRPTKQDRKEQIRENFPSGHFVVFTDNHRRFAKVFDHTDKHVIVFDIESRKEFPCPPEKLVLSSYKAWKAAQNGERFRDNSYVEIGTGSKVYGRVIKDKGDKVSVHNLSDHIYEQYAPDDLRACSEEEYREAVKPLKIDLTTYDDVGYLRMINPNCFNGLHAYHHTHAGFHVDLLDLAGVKLTNQELLGFSRGICFLVFNPQMGFLRRLDEMGLRVWKDSENNSIYYIEPDKERVSTALEDSNLIGYYYLLASGTERIKGLTTRIRNSELISGEEPVIALPDITEDEEDDPDDLFGLTQDDIIECVNTLFAYEDGASVENIDGSIETLRSWLESIALDTRQFHEVS